MNRERAARTLTFWLRPEFVLRVVNRFQALVGFDRAIALASGALTATIPLAIVTSTVAVEVGGKSTADRIISRYDLTGGGAQAVRDIFAPAAGASTSLGLLGVFFLLIAALSFSRAVQRLFETAWQLDPLSVRNTVNGLVWVGGLALYLGASGLIHASVGMGRLEVAAAVLVAPVTAGFLLWSGRVLSAKRIGRRDLLPFAVLGSVLFAFCSVGATAYVPYAFNSYTARYGVIGVVLAMISLLFSIMLTLVVTTAAGREIHDELDRIKRGERPPENEVRRQWDQLTTEARSRWKTMRRRSKSGGTGAAETEHR